MKKSFTFFHYSIPNSKCRKWKIFKILSENDELKFEKFEEEYLEQGKIETKDKILKTRVKIMMAGGWKKVIFVHPSKILIIMIFFQF